MKKILLSAALLAAFIGANAQELTSKKGTPILPEAGDWSIGISAAPFIDWALDKTRIMGASTPTSVNGAVTSQQDFTIVGLYVVDANTAYRGKLRLGFGSTSETGLVDDDTYTGTGTPPQVSDEMSTSATNITIGAGLQKSRGKGRLHGIYGAELGFMIGSGSTEYTYGNGFSGTNNSPTRTNFGSNNPASNVWVTKDEAGSTFGLNLDAFIGVEYFFAPKMSFSAEYNWGLIMSSTGEGSVTTETLNSTANGSQSNTSKTGESSSFGFDVSNINSSNTGNIVFHMYF